MASRVRRVSSRPTQTRTFAATAGSEKKNAMGGDDTNDDGERNGGGGRGRWKTPVLIAGGALAALVVVRLGMAVAARLRAKPTPTPRSRTFDPSDADERDDAAIVVVLTHDRRAPTTVTEIAQCAALMLTRARHPDRVFVRVPYPVALWNADHDVVCAWETRVRAAIDAECDYRRRLRDQPTPTPTPVFLHRNVRFERSRDVWSYTAAATEKRFRGTGPWWATADETYAYAVHPSTDPGRDWDVAAVAMLDDAERAQPSGNAVLSPTLTVRERLDPASAANWRMTFPRVCDRGDSRGVHLRRAPFAAQVAEPQPSAVAHYDDVFGRTRTIARLLDGVVRRTRRGPNRATHADITSVALKQRVVPHCPTRALGQSPRAGFAADASVVGTLADWREAIAKSPKSARERWIDLSCGVSWLASESEAVAKYGEARLRHWTPDDADAATANADDRAPTGFQQTPPPTAASAPAVHRNDDANDDQDQASPPPLDAALVPKHRKDRTVRYMPPAPATLPEGPRPVDVNVERRYENELVAAALTGDATSVSGFDAPTTATGVERASSR